MNRRCLDLVFLGIFTRGTGDFLVVLVDLLESFFCENIWEWPPGNEERKKIG